MKARPSEPTGEGWFEWAANGDRGLVQSSQWVLSWLSRWPMSIPAPLTAKED